MIALTNRAPIRSKESRIFFSRRGSSFLILWEMLLLEHPWLEGVSSTKAGIGKYPKQDIGKQLGFTQTNP